MARSDYTRETERRVERLLTELYDLLQIARPEDLYGSIVIEAKYQAGRPIGQVDVSVRYVMKRTDVTNAPRPARKPVTNGTSKFPHD
jgi:hypothetical protein